jgi:hypothetical protein
VLAHLGRQNADRGWARLSQKELAERWGVCRQSVNKAIGDLVAAGYVERVSQKDSGEAFCLYRVAIDRDEDVSATNDTPVSAIPDTPVSSSGDTRVASGATQVSPLTTPYSRPADLTDHSPLTPRSRKRSRGTGEVETQNGKIEPRFDISLPLRSRLAAWRYGKEALSPADRKLCGRWDRACGNACRDLVILEYCRFMQDKSPPRDAQASLVGFAESRQKRVRGLA